MNFNQILPLLIGFGFYLFPGIPLFAIEVRIIQPQILVSNQAIVAPGQEVQFKAIVTGNIGGPYICYDWNFGGPENASPGAKMSKIGDLNSTTQSLMVVFSTNAVGKTIPVTLRVNDQCKNFATTNLNVLVPKIEFITAGTTFKRDEIFNVLLRVSPPLPVTITNVLNLSKGTNSVDLGTRAHVQMFDFGLISASGTTNSLTQNNSGTQISSNNWVVIFKPFQTSINCLATINLDQTVRIKSELKRFTGCSGESVDIHITKRMRQYAVREDPQNSRVNQFDTEFEGAATLWADWGYGDGNGNYLFKDPATRYEPELLKAIAYKETQMNATNAGKNSLPTDIMQVDGGQKVTQIMNEGLQRDWNARALKVPIIDRRGITNMVFLVDERPKDPAPDNYAGVGMLYGLQANRPPGPATVATEGESIKWAVRELLFKQYNLRTVFTNIVVRGAGSTTFAIDEPALLDLEKTLDRFGPREERGAYGKSVLQLMNEGTMPRRNNIQYVWPILTNQKARHD